MGHIFLYSNQPWVILHKANGLKTNFDTFDDPYLVHLNYSTVILIFSHFLIIRNINISTALWAHRQIILHKGTKIGYLSLPTLNRSFHSYLLAIHFLFEIINLNSSSSSSWSCPALSFDSDEKGPPHMYVASAIRCKLSAHSCRFTSTSVLYHLCYE